VSVEVAPFDPAESSKPPVVLAQESISVDWRERTCRVELRGPVTARSLDQLDELLRGVGLSDGRVLISLADAVVSHELSAELLAFSRRLAGVGATFEVRSVPAARPG
jgi:hypothetical protein